LNRFGVINAFTNAAQKLSPLQRIEMERFAGTLRKLLYNSSFLSSQAKQILGFFSYQLFNERPAKPVRASRVVVCFLFSKLSNIGQKSFRLSHSLKLREAASFVQHPANEAIKDTECQRPFYFY